MPLIITRGAASAKGFGFTGTSSATGGSQSYTTPGIYTWIAPVGVTKVSVIVIGGGAGGLKAISYFCCCTSNQYYGNGYGGGSGGTAYINNYTVVPGNSYTVQVGAGGGPSGSGGITLFNNYCTVYTTATNNCIGGTGYANAGCGAGFVGGKGGCYGLRTSNGVYTGSGGGGTSFGPLVSCRGRGGTNSSSYFAYGYAGTCGGAGGGASAAAVFMYGGNGGGGGGIGLFGRGSSGGQQVCISSGGNAGSGGTNGSNGTGTSGSGNGGSYGGGGGGGAFLSGTRNCGGSGAGGAVRIVWPGCSRQFPATSVGSP
jgi:hypothetical protein